MEFRVITKEMDLYPYQQLFFTTLEYDDLQQVFPSKGTATVPLTALGGDHVMLLSGIASPRQMQIDLEPLAKSLHPLVFSDHHHFRPKDVERINREFAALPSPRRIITTEKDATRLADVEGLSEEVRNSLYVLPVRIRFMLEQEEKFNEKIIGYVRKNSRNSILAQAKDDHSPQDSNRSGNGTRTISFRNNR